MTIRLHHGKENQNGTAKELNLILTTDSGECTTSVLNPLGGVREDVLASLKQMVEELEYQKWLLIEKKKQNTSFDINCEHKKNKRTGILTDKKKCLDCGDYFN